ncbi:MAG: diacylglycerol kinase [Patescibacteria group bacterium]
MNADSAAHKPRNWRDKLLVGFYGVKSAFRTEPTLWMQVILGSIATVLSLILGGQWVYVKQTIFLTVAVVLAELVNTAIEYLCDLVEPKKNAKIKKTKDILAGVVLIVSIVAISITIIDLIRILRDYYM